MHRDIARYTYTAYISPFAISSPTSGTVEVRRNAIASFAYYFFDAVHCICERCGIESKRDRRVPNISSVCLHDSCTPLLRVNSSSLKNHTNYGFRPYPQIYKISNTLSLEVLNIGDQLSRRDTSVLFQQAFVRVRSLLDHHNPWDRLPNGKWRLDYDHMYVLAAENGDLQPLYPKLTYEILHNVINGIYDFFIDVAKGEFFTCDFDIFVAFDDHSLVDIGHGALFYT